MNTFTPNFGDCITGRFFNLLANKEITTVPYEHPEESYLTVGSHLRAATEKNIVIGAGFISENDDLGKGDWKEYTNRVYRVPKEFLSVRGPKTREKLLKMGIDCPERYGDPLFLFPLIYNPIIRVKYKIGVIPHYIDKKSLDFIRFYNHYSKLYTIKVIDIETKYNYQKFINDIKECEYIISSTLHGVIIALAYFKKTIWTRFSEKVIGGDFKFQDFFSSLNVVYKDPRYHDIHLLKKYILCDKENMLKLGEQIISCCPFIESERSEQLNKLWSDYISANDFTKS